MTGDLNLNRIDKQRYRPAADVEDVLDDLRRNLVTGEKYRVARLAIARSLAEPDAVEPLARGTEMGNSIEGQTLLGDESALWSCLIVESYPKLITTVEEFRSVLEAHWTRGARLLQADLEEVDMRSARFITKLAGMAKPETGPSDGDSQERPQRSGTVSVRIGEVSQDVRTDTEVSVVLNGLGISPHIAILGKPRSGKTQVGLAMAEQITANSQLPVLFIDSKGEFVKGAQIAPKKGNRGRALVDRIPNIEPIDVPKQTVPLDFLFRTANSQPIELAQTALSFCDTFQKALRPKSDVALDAFREIIQDLLATHRGPISFDVIRDAVRNANELSGKAKDTIEVKLNEVCALRLFEPGMSPEEFFSRRWVIGLGGATEETRRLVIFLLLDALAKYMLSLRDSETDRGGARTLRHLLVIDEAKDVLSHRQHDALGSLVRKSAAKGGVVIVQSQSADDFNQDDEDFLAQIGSFVVFASTTNGVKSLRTAFGRRLAPENFSDRDLPPGIAWAKLPNAELFKVRAWSAAREG